MALEFCQGTLHVLKYKTETKSKIFQAFDPNQIQKTCRQKTLNIVTNYYVQNKNLIYGDRELKLGKIAFMRN